MASLDARRTPLPTLWKPTPIFLCPFDANNEVLRILIKISFPCRHTYFSLFLFIQVSEQDYTSSASFLRAYYQKIPEYRAPSLPCWSLPLLSCCSVLLVATGWPSQLSGRFIA